MIIHYLLAITVVLLVVPEFKFEHQSPHPLEHQSPHPLGPLVLLLIAILRVIASSGSIPQAATSIIRF